MEKQLLIKKLIFCIVFILNVSNLKSGQAADLNDIKSQTFEKFLDFIRSNRESKTPSCDFYDFFKNDFKKDFIFEEPILWYIFNSFDKNEQVSENLIRKERLLFLKLKKALSNEDSGFLGKERKKFLSTGGNSKDSFDVIMKKLYPELSKIYYTYICFHDAYEKLLARKIINSADDLASILMFMDEETKLGNGYFDARSCSSFEMISENLFNKISTCFPEETGQLIARERLQLKTITEREKMLKEERSSFAVLQKNCLCSKDRALGLQKHREDNEEKQNLKHHFFTWMLPVCKKLELERKRLEQENARQEFERARQVNYLKSIWSRWQDFRQIQKQLFFEKNVIESNARYAQQVELLREQREKILMAEDFHNNAVKESSSSLRVNEIKRLELLEQKKACREAKIQRRAYRKSLREAFERNAKNLETTALKRIQRSFLVGKAWQYDPYSITNVRKFIN